jgi:hypothetical protein
MFEVFLGSAVTHQLFADDLELFSSVKTIVNTASLQSALHIGKSYSRILYTLDDCRLDIAQNVSDLRVAIEYDTSSSNRSNTTEIRCFLPVRFRLPCFSYIAHAISVQ